MNSSKKSSSVAVIVAHPDDETLWMGGTILMRQSWRWFVLSLCRGKDPDRAPRFFQALEALESEGRMADLDDGPEQIPLGKKEVQEAILQGLPANRFDRIFSHSPAGEYTQHRRHEEIGEAVISLWHTGRLHTDELWLFAYEDRRKYYLPQPIKTAHYYQVLPEDIWQKKYAIITQTYGFRKDGFEAETTPRAEAFWRFTDPAVAHQWFIDEVFQRESSVTL